ncbi:MAG: response regulator [Proteobacteria bacterium]|nr:response regulator [Pseudomonadota bacterium]MBU1594570.1 response regulator [Pseudomonadota bacterium]
MPKPVLLIVDDSAANLRQLNDLLRHDYAIHTAKSGEDALNFLHGGAKKPDLVLLDIMMEPMSGHEVCRRLKSDEATRDIPVIFVTVMDEEYDEEQGLNLGAVDYITKPIRPALVKARVRNHLELKHHRDNLCDTVQARTDELESMRTVIVEALADLTESRDLETGWHIRRTQNYVRLLAEHLSLKDPANWRFSPTEIDLLYSAASLHDIGKVKIEDRILFKPGKLDQEEFAAMKKHVEYGFDLLNKIGRRLQGNTFLRKAAEIAHTHHAKWDGSGYPSGFKGTDIPHSGRIMAVADVYDALVSKRKYKAPRMHSEAVQEISKGRGTHFDPEVADAFLLLQEEFRTIALEYADDEEQRQALLS